MAAAVSHALDLERFLEEKGFAKRPGALLSGIGARLQRASDLPLLSQRLHERPTGISPLDSLLSGGLPKGTVELAGRRSSGRLSIGLAALAQTTSGGEPAALVDLASHLDPQAADAAGVDLTRVLWVRPRRVKEALAAAEMLLATGFPLVVADLGLNPRGVRYTPDAAWVRLARSAKAQRASLLLLTPYRVCAIAAETVLTASAARPVWEGDGPSPRLLAGVRSRVTLEKSGHGTPARTAELLLAVPDAIQAICDLRSAICDVEPSISTSPDFQIDRPIPRSPAGIRRPA